jgi:hypothetical protein
VPNVTGRFVHRCLTPASGCPNYPGRTTDVCTPGDVCCWQSGKQWFQAACDGHWRSPVRVSSCTPQITP